MFVDRHPVPARLRTAAKDAAFGIREELEGVIARIRARWPTTHIIVRTDSGFCRDDIMTFIENAHNVDYVLGLARNARLAKLSAQAMADAMAQTLESGQACRRFCTFPYRTRQSWSAERRVIAKAEALPGQGEGQPCKENNRYIVTSLDRPGRALCEDFYCARGDAENRLREVKCDLFAERSSSNLFDANAVRLCLSAFAHVLYNRLRRSLARTPLGDASPTTLALKLMRIGARVRISATPHPCPTPVPTRPPLPPHGRCRRRADVPPVTHPAASCSCKPGAGLRLSATPQQRRHRASPGPRGSRSHANPGLWPPCARLARQ